MRARLERPRRILTLSLLVCLSALAAGCRSRPAGIGVAPAEVASLEEAERLRPEVAAVHAVGLDDAGIAALARLQGLTALLLDDCSQTNAGMRTIGSFERLETLSLARCDSFGDAGLAELEGLKNLRALKISENDAITDAGLASLGEIASLERLSLMELPQVGDAGLQHLYGLSGLRELTLHHCGGVTQEGVAALLEALPDCHLNHGGATGKIAWVASGDDIARLGERDIHVYGVGLLDADLLALSFKGSVEGIDLLDSPEISDEGLAHLSRMSGLRWLRLRGGSITDEGVRALSGQSSLERLEFHACPAITPAGLGLLAELPKLSRLRLAWCRGVAADDLPILQKAMPACRISLEP